MSPNKISPGVCGCGIADTDSDNDGIANCIDNCPNLAGVQGDACNDGNAGTINDVITANCVCAGTQPNDCLGVPGGTAQPGTACNDNNAATGNDTWSASCVCVGQLIDCLGVPGGSALPGTACSDNNACTINDVYSASCVCAGTVLDTDGDGTCDAQDGCPTDPNKIAPGVCGCGVADTDSDNDGLADCIDNCPNLTGQVGSPCNDGNAATINDVITANCVCQGSTVDCNDNNACTADSYNGTVCVNTPLPDTDGDGTCDLTDGCPSDSNKISAGVCGCGNPEPGATCNDNNSATINDVITANCVCQGTLLGNDCLGVPGGSALPGTACNDNNANTGNDTWSANCVCVGQPLDCLGCTGRHGRNWLCLQ